MIFKRLLGYRIDINAKIALLNCFMEDIPSNFFELEMQSLMEKEPEWPKMYRELKNVELIGINCSI